MKKTVFEIYSSLVCFVALVCCSVWLGIGLYSLAGVFEPEITLDSWYYQRHQSNQQFQLPFAEPIFLEPPSAIEVNKPAPIEKISDNEISKKRQENYQLVLQSEVRKHRQELIRSLIAVCICLPLFFLHWRFVRPR
jgi:hypothetical protein